MKTARFFCIIYLALSIIGLFYAVKVEEIPSILTALFAIGVFSILLVLLNKMLKKPRTLIQDRPGFTKFGLFPEYKYPRDRKVYNCTASSLVIKNEVGIEDDRIITCPGCANNELEWPPHGDAYQCEKCEVNFQVYGNSIYFWL